MCCHATSDPRRRDGSSTATYAFGTRMTGRDRGHRRDRPRCGASTPSRACRGRPGRRTGWRSSAAGSPRRRPPGCPSRTRWSSPPPTRRAGRAPARCCSRGTTSAVSCSSPTTTSRKGTEARGQPVRRAWSSRGFRCSARCWSPGAVERVDRAETEAYFAQPAARLAARRLGQPAVAGARRPGRARRPVRGRGERRGSPDGRRCPRRRTGAGCGWSRRPSSSGRAEQPPARPAALPPAPARTTGSSSGSHREPERGEPWPSRARRLGDRRPAAAACSRTGGCGSATAVSFFGFQFTAVAVPVQMYADHALVALGRPARRRRPRPAADLRRSGAARSPTRVDRRRLLLGQLAADLGRPPSACWRRRCSAWTARCVLLALVAVQSAAFAISSPTRQAIIPRLVPADWCRRRTRWTTRRPRSAGVLGPLAAGLILALVDRHRRCRRVRGRRAAVHGRVLGDAAAAADPAGRTRRRRSRGRAARASSTACATWPTQPVLLLSFAIDIVAMVLAMPRALFPEVADERFGGGAAVGWLFARDRDRLGARPA